MVYDHSIVIEANLADNEPQAAQATKEELLKEYEDWGSDTGVIMKSIETTNKRSIEVLFPPLDMYAESSVALLGDVVSIFKHMVHIVGILTAVAPHLGAGASQDTEDAYLVLPQLLSDPRATETNVAVCWIKNIVTT